MRISIIAAIGQNRAIGIAGELPWKKLAEDKHRFHELTSDHAIIMGRKTYKSIGHPLPDRTNIIISRNADLQIAGTRVVHSLEEALKTVKDDPEVFVIGGAEIYRLALPKADRLYITEVKAAPRTDTFFPEFDETDFELIWESHHQKDPRNEFDTTFKIYERRRKEN